MSLKLITVLIITIKLRVFPLEALTTATSHITLIWSGTKHSFNSAGGRCRDKIMGNIRTCPDRRGQHVSLWAGLVVTHHLRSVVCFCVVQSFKWILCSFTVSSCCSHRHETTQKSTPTYRCWPDIMPNDLNQALLQPQSNGLYSKHKTQTEFK